MELFFFDLQLFSEEKTEQATPKKKRDSRNKGQVVFSKDLSSSFALLMVFIYLNFFKKTIVEKLYQFMLKLYGVSTKDIDSMFEIPNIMDLMFETGMLIVSLVMPIALVAMFIGLMTTYLQVGVLFTIEPIKPKLDKISPIKGFKRLFSMRSLVELAKAVSKGTILLYIAYSYVINKINLFMKVLIIHLRAFHILCGI